MSTNSINNQEHAGVPASGLQLLDTKLAAATLRISERALWTLTAPRGELQCVHIGRSVRYTQQSLMAFIGANTVPTAALIAGGGARAFGTFTSGRGCNDDPLA